VKDYQRDFLAFALETGVLRFGDFTLKSGRKSPYFFNSGLFRTGAAIARLGRFYARAIVENGPDFDMLFGPAYKGIPLATAVAIALAQQHDRDLPFAFDRKEAKDHGEGGSIIGAPLAGRVLIVDDVISAGLSVDASVQRIRAAGAQPAGVFIALDRQERAAEGELSAAAAVAQRNGFPVQAIAGLDTLVEFLAGDPQRAGQLAAIREYLARFGA
jgi:orotate phosphoribosyltransferase